MEEMGAKELMKEVGDRMVWTCLCPKVLRADQTYCEDCQDYTPLSAIASWLRRMETEQSPAQRRLIDRLLELDIPCGIFWITDAEAELSDKRSLEAGAKFFWELEDGWRLTQDRSGYRLEQRTVAA